MDSTTASAPTTVASALRSDKKAPAIEVTNAHSRAGDNGTSLAGHPEQKKSTSPAPSGSLTLHTGNSNGQPVSNAASNPEAHNAVANGRRVRFLDQDPVPPSLRGREACLAQITEREAVVWVDGIRRCVPKSWLVGESDASAKTALGGSQMTSTPTLEGRKPEPSPTSPSPADDNAYITQEEWDALFDECEKARMPWGAAIQFIEDTLGISLDDWDVRITQKQRQQVMERLKSLQTAS